MALGLLEEWRRHHPASRPSHAAVGSRTVEWSVGSEEEDVHEDRYMRPIDRWVIGAVVIIAVALIAASVLRPEAIATYVSALGGVGAVSVAYFVFGR